MVSPLGVAGTAANRLKRRNLGNLSARRIRKIDSFGISGKLFPVQHSMKSTSGRRSARALVFRARHAIQFQCEPLADLLPCFDRGLPDDLRRHGNARRRTGLASAGARWAHLLPAPIADAVRDGKPVPICLDTVLRLAQDKNGQVRLARMKLADAETDQEWANKFWLPDLSAGMAAYHHDGGIQDFQGNVVRSTYNSAIAGLEITGKYDPKEILFRRVEAERQVWAQKGELSKLTSENLLDASTTYIDLLSARTGIVVSEETEVSPCRNCSSRPRPWRRSIRARASRCRASRPS